MDYAFFITFLKYFTNFSFFLCIIERKYNNQHRKEMMTQNIEPEFQNPVKINVIKITLS